MAVLAGTKVEIVLAMCDTCFHTPGGVAPSKQAPAAGPESETETESEAEAEAESGSEESEEPTGPVPKPAADLRAEDFRVIDPTDLPLYFGRPQFSLWKGQYGFFAETLSQPMEQNGTAVAHGFLAGAQTGLLFKVCPSGTPYQGGRWYGGRPLDPNQPPQGPDRLQWTVLLDRRSCALDP